VTIRDWERAFKRTEGLKRKKPLTRQKPKRWPTAKRKKGITARERAQKHRALVESERTAKQEVRNRDRHCRFPLCGCQRAHIDYLKRRLTVSHDFHKGMGGDPTGGVSIPALMIAFCKWRHQDAPVSVHGKTLRTVYLTPDHNEGPVAFEIDLHALDPDRYTVSEWFEVGREHYVEGGSETLRLAPLTPEQAEILDELAEMKR
jgi:hypothetical protein